MNGPAGSPPLGADPGRRHRAAAAAAIGVAMLVAYAVADTTLPGHLPAGVVLKGVVLGGLQAMVAMGLVLLYRAFRVVNFAQGALGAVGLTIAVVLSSGAHWGYAEAVPAGLAATVVLGWVIDRVMRRFTGSSRVVFTVATIGLAELLNAANVELPRTVDLRGTPTLDTPFSFRFSVRPLTFTGDALIALGAVVVVLAGLWWFLQRTETGVAIRAAADNRERAVLLGIPVHRLSSLTWMLAAGLAAVGAMLAAPINGVSVGSPVDASALLAPLAAAVLAGMESLPLTVVWSVVLGVVDQASFWSFHNQVYSQIVFFVLVMAGMLVWSMARRQQAPGAETPPGADRVHGPAPWSDLRPVRHARRVLLAAGLAGAVLVPLVSSAPVVVAFEYVAIFVILALSLVVLSGWAGQISLAQYAFAGVGAATTGTLLFHFHVQFLVAMAAAAVMGGIVACLVGLPALRIRGLDLAVATLAFAAPVSSWLLSPTYLPWSNPVAPEVTPPVLFHRFDLALPGTFYELCVLTMVVCLWAVRNLRRTRSGRAVLAVRDNPRAAAAYGIGPVRSRLFAFAVAGALAGVAGSLIVVSTSGMPAAGFAPGESVSVLAMAVIGGLGSIAGAVAGAVYAEGVVHFLPQVWQLVADGGGLLVLLLAMPDGLAGLLVRVGDRAAEILAGRAGARGQAGAAGPGDDRGLSAAETAALRMGALEDLEALEQTAPESSAPDAGPLTGAAMIELQHVHVSYGRSTVLADVSLGAAQGEVLALLGTNGAGKTTTLRAIAGITRPRHGTVRYLGRDIGDWSPADRVGAGLVTVLGGRSVFAGLTVADNLRVGTWTARHRHRESGVSSVEQERVLDMFPALRPRREQLAGSLSGGEQQMLALAQSLLCRPKVLLIDELSLGLSPVAVSALLAVLRDLASGGVTVVLVEQSVNVATAIAGRAVFMERGRVRFSGPTPDLSSQPDLLRSVFLRAADRADRKRPAPRNPAGAAAAPSGPIDVAELIAGLPTGEAEPSAAAVVPGVGAGVLDGAGWTVGDRPMSVDDVVALLAGVERPDVGGGADAVGWPLVPGAVVPALAGGGAAVFSVVGVSKHFGGVVALRDVSFSVAPGEILGIIGANGAGKTTVFDLCSGFTRPDTGSVRLDGHDVTHLRPAARARLGLGRVFQDVRLWPSMTVAEALATALERHVSVRDPLAGALGLVAVERAESEVAERADELLGRFGLTRFATRLVGDLSTGMRRVVELACAIGHEPRVLLLDEPTAGVAQRESDTLAELILGLREQSGTAFVVIEHDVPLISSVADRLVCLHVGEVIADGAAASVLQDPAVVASYLASEDLDSARVGAPVGAGNRP